MRTVLVAVALASGLVVGACHRAFGCLNDTECNLDGVAGVCEDVGSCSFPDTDCPSGRRYGDHAASDLVGECVEPVAAGTSGGEGSGTTVGELCVLEASPPLRVDQDGTVVEGLRFDVVGEAAIRVEGAANVTIRDVEIHHDGAPGIDVVDAPNVRIEDVVVIHEGDDPGEGDGGIQIDSSPGLVVTRVRVTGSRRGLGLSDSEDGHVSFVEFHDIRGGDGIYAGSCDRLVVEDFSFENALDITIADPFSGVFIQHSADVEIRRGLLDGLNSAFGHGVLVEVEGRPANALVEDVDAVRMTNGGFGAWSADNVTFRRTRARDNLCDNMGGLFPEPSSSGGTVWSHEPNAANVGIEDSSYTALCDQTRVWPEGTFVPEELTEQEFTARAPIRISPCWATGS